jgi:hypothetical protein
MAWRLEEPTVFRPWRRQLPKREPAAEPRASRDRVPKRVPAWYVLEPARQESRPGVPTRVSRQEPGLAPVGERRKRWALNSPQALN